MTDVRTRFAPSPTGFMHVGGVRTALFAWLLAKNMGGKFILRIEDTDKAREVEGSIEHIVESLKWLGLEFDEGPGVNGNYGPYLQSERLELYKQEAKRLLEAGRAYVDISTPEMVKNWRDEANANKRPFLFREYREQANGGKDWDGSKPLRFLSSPSRMNWHDIVRGDLTAGEEVIDDFVIIKSDGYPTYNFAHVVDDEFMKISHVIRGEEFISSQPKFLDLIDALGYDRPIFATAPPILGENDGKKLSKRDGAKDVLDYRAEGYLPEAIVNFLATLGWNDGTTQEIFTTKELVEKFSLERLQPSGARFDAERLVWLNGQHIRRLSLDALYDKISSNYWPEASKNHVETYKKAVLALVHERLKYFAELSDLTSFFFESPQIDESLLTKMAGDEGKDYLLRTIEALNPAEFNHDSLEQTLRGLVESLNTKTGKLFKLLRVAITGRDVAPGLFETMVVLGKDETIKRLNAALRNL